MTQGDFYTEQFYTWEYRGRGWHVADEPIELEPPFMPFFRHGYGIGRHDDGKRHTLVSNIIEFIKGPKPKVGDNDLLLDYTYLEQFSSLPDRRHIALRLLFPQDRRIAPERMKAFLISLTYTTSIFSFELIGTGPRISIQIVCDEAHADTVSTYFRAYFPHATILEVATGIFTEGMPTALADFGFKNEWFRPLAMASSFSLDPHTSIVAALEALGEDELAGIQVLFQTTSNAWGESVIRGVTVHGDTSFFNDDVDAPKQAFAKTQSPLYGATIRTFAQAREPSKAMRILEQISNMLIISTKSEANSLISLPSQEYTFERRMYDIAFRESHRMGMLLNLDELVTLVHIPSETIASRKLFASSRKTKETPRIAKGKEYLLGYNPHLGLDEPITVSTEDRLKHMHLIGSTGTGKSTMLAQLIAQDIEHNHGVILLDPHGDLVENVLALVPDDRIKDVVLIDPSDSEFPIGLNLLQATTDIEKEVLVSDLVASFRRYTTSWGDQMSAVLGNAIAALLDQNRPYSLHDLRRFLLEKDFRTSIVRTVSDPSIAYYWLKEYPLSKSTSIGPILTRLDTFLRPKSIRNMVVQKHGINVGKLLEGNAIVLCKLSQGLIGRENSYLLGSMLLSLIHQAILKRQELSKRQPVFLYLDEFHTFITPSITEMLSGIRKYNVGITLSHQDLQQLQREGDLLNSVLSNCGIRVMFRIGEPDAKKLQEGLASFTHTDLQSLEPGEAIVRIEQPQHDCAIDTIPLPDIDADTVSHKREYIIAVVRECYATPRAEVEAMLRKDFSISEERFEKQPAAEPVISSAPAKQYTQPVQEKPSQKEKNEEQIRSISQHRYLQTLIKKMAEQKGYKAMLEAALPFGDGNVDVLLEKDGKTIACEISVTTTKAWEVHNIQKCLAAGYDKITVCSQDSKHLAGIQRIAMESIPEAQQAKILFITPEQLFALFDTENARIPEPEQIVMKGYRVNVQYGGADTSESVKQQDAVSKIVAEALQKMKKKGK